MQVVRDVPTLEVRFGIVRHTPDKLVVLLDGPLQVAALVVNSGPLAIPFDIVRTPRQYVVELGEEGIQILGAEEPVASLVVRVDTGGFAQRSEVQTKPRDKELVQ